MSKRKPSADAARSTTKKARGGKSRSKLQDDFLVESDGDNDDDREFKAFHDDEDGENGVEEKEEGDDDLYADETADEKRVRLAKEYIAKLEKEKAEQSEDEGIEDVIGHRLQQDVVQSRGDYQAPMADKLASLSPASLPITIRRGHRLPVTCMTLDKDEKFAYTGSKDGTIIQWDLVHGTKKLIKRSTKAAPTIGHSDEVLCIAVSDDCKYLASGGRDKILRIWDTSSLKQLADWKGHRDAISALAFRQHSLQLFSASHDRTVKVWNIEQMAYVETLYGHQSEVNGLASLSLDRAVSVGSDKTLRVWKIVEQSQLLFRGHSASIDCVAMFSEDRYLAGSQDGSVSLWNVKKKKPTSVSLNAHSQQWVTAVAALPFSDLGASGSSDGVLRLWKCGTSGPHTNKLLPLLSIQLTGFINAIAFAPSGKFLIVAVGQEHRLGRWSRIPQARNGIHIINLSERAAKPDFK